MATQYWVVRRDPIWHTRDEAGNVMAHEVLDSGYDGEDLHAAAVHLACRQAVEDSGHEREWRIESSDPADSTADEPGGRTALDRAIEAEGVTTEEVYRALVADPYDLSEHDALAALDCRSECVCEDCVTARG